MKRSGTKNPKSPSYIEQTTTWVAGEIARARAKHSQLHVNGPGHRELPLRLHRRAVLEQLTLEKLSVGDFLQQQETTRPTLAQDLVIPGAITIVAAHHVGREEALPH